MRVFMEFEAPDYPTNGINEFKRSLESPEYIGNLCTYAAFDNCGVIVGMLATRNSGRHIALFFVDSAGNSNMRLINKYLPSDYNDSVSKRIRLKEPLAPDGIFEEMFCNFPKPVDWLMKLRNALVKPFGLQGGGGFRNLVSERSDEEIIICKKDRHLCFWAGIYCSRPEDGWQVASVTTVVKFNNFFGKIYFIGIWGFHKLLVKSLFRKAINK